MFDIDTKGLFNFGKSIIDRLIPDPAQKAEANLKLLELQQNGELKVEEFAVKREEIAKDDRVSARSMQEAALNSDDKFSKRFIYWFSIFWSVAGATYIGFITFSEIPANNVRFADTILGFVLGTAISSMFQYFYGSTSSSKVKDETIKNIMNK